MNVTLVGLPGVGKSTLGAQLARRLRLAFFDTDREIERRIGCSVDAYFRRSGESSFRDLEADTLTELLSEGGRVIATGGGIVTRTANRAALKSSSHAIYLYAAPEHLALRLRDDDSRPLLRGEDRLARMRELHEVRDPLYRDVASSVIVTIGRGRRAIVDAMEQRLRPTVRTDTRP